jgi:hypothetical protein
MSGDDVCDCCMESEVEVSQTCPGCGKTMCEDCVEESKDGLCPECEEEA